MQFNQIPPVTKFLLLVNILLFFAPNLFEHIDFEKWILYPLNTQNFYPYQLLTSMFMHAGMLHIVFNMYGLFSFGSILEKILGTHRFLLLYFLSGLGGGAMYLLCVHLGFLFAAPVLGASGAISGLLIAFATLFPLVKFNLFLIPINLKASWILPIMIGLALLSMTAFGSSMGNIAHAAHLGGGLVGYALVIYWKNSTNNPPII